MNIEFINSQRNVLVKALKNCILWGKLIYVTYNLYVKIRSYLVNIIVKESVLCKKLQIYWDLDFQRIRKFKISHKVCELHFATCGTERVPEMHDEKSARNILFKKTEIKSFDGNNIGLSHTQ